MQQLACLKIFGFDVKCLEIKSESVRSMQQCIIMIGRDDADILPVHGHKPNLWNFSRFNIYWKNCFECQM